MVRLPVSSPRAAQQTHQRRIVDRRRGVGQGGERGDAAGGGGLARRRRWSRGIQSRARRGRAHVHQAGAQHGAVAVDRRDAVRAAERRRQDRRSAIADEQRARLVEAAARVEQANAGEQDVASRGARLVALHAVPLPMSAWRPWSQIAPAAVNGGLSPRRVSVRLTCVFAWRRPRPPRNPCPAACAASAGLRLPHRLRPRRGLVASGQIEGQLQGAGRQHHGGIHRLPDLLTPGCACKPWPSPGRPLASPPSPAYTPPPVRPVGIGGAIQERAP